MEFGGPIGSMVGILVTLGISCTVAEFCGYWLHRLLHCEKVPVMSRSHMIHHLLIYGPGQPMRHEHYQDATGNRPSLGNVGLEWIVPCGGILAILWSLMLVLHIRPLFQLVAMATLILWPVFMFSYLHDRMHLSKFWMAQTPILGKWFCAARRLHDIHHHSVNEHGQMDNNFGIGFFLFDRIFRTIARRHRPFNRTGFEAARKRYELLQLDGTMLEDPEISTNLTMSAECE
jgi:hypothetical protein